MGGEGEHLRVHIASLTDRTQAANEPPLLVNEVTVDLRGYLPAHFKDTANMIGLTLDDITGMFNAARWQLQDFMRLIDKKPGG